VNTEDVGDIAIGPFILKALLVLSRVLSERSVVGIGVSPKFAVCVSIAAIWTGSPRVLCLTLNVVSLLE